MCSLKLARWLLADKYRLVDRRDSLHPYVKIPCPSPRQSLGRLLGWPPAQLLLSLGGRCLRHTGRRGPHSFPQTTGFLAQDGREALAPARKGRVWSKNRDLDFFVGIEFDKQSLPDQENFFNIF